MCELGRRHSEEEVGLDLYFYVQCCTEHERNDLFSLLGMALLINLDVETEKKECKKGEIGGGGGLKRCDVCVIDMNHL